MQAMQAAWKCVDFLFLDKYVSLHTFPFSTWLLFYYRVVIDTNFCDLFLADILFLVSFKL